MKNVSAYALLLTALLTGCVYGKVKLNSTDRSYIPYGEISELIFTNTHKNYDTLILHHYTNTVSNFDHFINRGFGLTQDRKKRASEVYATGDPDAALKRTIRKQASQQAYIKYDIFFTFHKGQQDTKPHLYYGLDRMKGSLSFSDLKLSSLQTDQKLYTDVVVLESTADTLFEISRIYWSVAHGLIRIEEKSGEHWTLVSKTLKK